MDTIYYMLGKIVQIVLVLFIVAGLLMIVGFVYPQFKPSSLFGKVNFDFLPSPTNYSSRLAPKNADGTYGIALGTYGTVYQSGAPYNSTHTALPGSIKNGEYLAYSEEGTYPGPAGSPQIFNGGLDASTRANYIRNLSIYTGGTVTYGTTFVGEAKGEMFKNGTFQILILDASGRIITSFPAINTGVWAIPGWARFQATIPQRLPSNTPCAMVFVSQNTSVRFGMNVRCN